MAKITYLFGAGASIGSFPIVDKLAAAIIGVAHKVDGIITQCSREPKEYADKLDSLKRAREDLYNLYENCKKHISIDTYIRKLYLTRGDETIYKETKSTIVLFFELYRYYHNDTDKRYDAFLAALLDEETLHLPDEINIISWNYDYEFERAYLNYKPDLKGIDYVFHELNITYKNSAHQKGGFKDKFGVIKVNGTIGYYQRSNNRHHFQKIGFGKHDLFTQNVASEEPDNLWPIIECYIDRTYTNILEPAISFSWEPDFGERNVKEEIVDALTNTEILVIIGYSFPYFNREIDKLIFQNIKDQYGTKIYIQDSKADLLMENIQALKYGHQTQIIPLKNLSQFHIPHELE